MNKILHFASAMFLAFASSMTFAQTTVTFTAGETIGSNTTAEGEDQMSKDGVTITTSAGGFNCSNKSGSQYRFAMSSTNTISSTVGNITKIEFTCTANGDAKYGPGNFTTESGNYTYEGKIGTWTGNANTVTFSAVTAQLRATEIVVTIGGSVNPNPDPTPDPDPDPEVTFTASNIAGLNAMTKDLANVNLTLNNAKVVYANGDIVSVREGDKAILFYYTELDLPRNAILNGKVKVDYAYYYGMPEVKKNDYTNADSLTITAATDATLDATTATLTDILALNHVADLVKIENVTLTKVENNFYAVSGNNRVQLYKNVANVGAYEGQTVTIYAIFNNIYKNAPQLSVVDIEGGQVKLEKAANIAEFKEKKGTAVLTLQNAQVLYAGQNDIFVRDATGAIDFYMSNLDWKQNQILNGTITGTYATFNNLPELTSPIDNKVTATNGEAARAHEVGLDEISAEGYGCDLIQVSGLTLKSFKNGEYTDTYAYSEDGDSIQVYDKFKVVAGKWVEGQTYTIKGILVPYKETLELYPIEDYTAQVAPEPTVITAENIAAFKALKNGTTATLTLNDAQVLYTWTTNKGNTQTYVRDASGAIMFYNTGLQLAQNQIVNGKVSLKLSIYNDLPEAVKADDTNAASLTLTQGTEAEAKIINVADVANYVSDLVVLENVQVVASEDTAKYYAVSGTDSLQIYNGFHLDGYTIGTTAEGETTSVKGIISQYKTTYEIYPIEQVVTGIDSLKANKSVNAPTYNLAGQRVDASYKGVVIKGGKKYLQK